MPLNEAMALSLALAESEIKRKQTESLLAELRQMYANQEKAFLDLVKENKERDEAAAAAKKPGEESPKNELKPEPALARQKASKAVN